MWHERTRVELVTDGENWETANYVLFLEEPDGDAGELQQDLHAEL